MEFEFLGARCTVSDCRQHDYLPFTCEGCSEQFCDSHRTRDAHACSARPAATQEPVPCFACGEIIAHLRRDAAPAARAAAKRAHERSCTRARADAPTCALPACAARLAAPMHCTRCARAYCVAHRAVARHGCAPSRSARPTRATARSSRRSANSAVTPAGDARIDGADRVYAEVFFRGDARASREHIYFFFGRRWTVGRALEAISKEAKVPLVANGGRRLQMRVNGRVCAMLDRVEDALPQHIAVTVEYADAPHSSCSSEARQIKPSIEVEKVR